MKNLKSIIAFLIILIFCNQKIYAQQGTLDPTFGDGGTVVVEKPFFNGISLIQTDGKIILLSLGSVLDRFNADGTYDETFGKHGRVTLNFDKKLYSENNSFALQNDGKIVCNGYYYADNGNIYSGVFRCNPDGSIDSSFGTNGMDSIRIDNLNFGTGIVIQPDGKIVVSGDTRKSFYEDTKTFIYRLMPNGGLDPSFGEEGIVINKHSLDINSAGLVIRPDGKLVIGSTYNTYDYTLSYQLESFNADGSIDNSFGVKGIAKFIFGENQTVYWASQMRNLVLQEDGKIVCAGTSGIGKNEMALCRFNENGTIDAGFGENGGIITSLENTNEVYNFDLDLQPDGKILTCGGALIAFSFSEIVICRYQDNGQLDPEFGNSGITVVSSDIMNVSTQSIHYLNDGKILATGQISYPSSETGIIMVRLNGDNVLAANFKEVKATQTNEAITITWQTLNESGTKSFTVERSNNANDFAGINTVPSKGVASTYSYTDKNPLSGTSYYRIRENAANGTNTFSPVVKVVFNDNGVISLFPNPAKNTVTVKGLNKNIIAIIKITDMQGREIRKQIFSQSNTATLNIRALAQGSYFVLVEENGKVTRLRIVKE
ncbi:MAG: T9SS type A sorting domain-containing protein [Chitinophagaceae bacterium]